MGRTRETTRHSRVTGGSPEDTLGVTHGDTGNPGGAREHLGDPGLTREDTWGDPGLTQGDTGDQGGTF